MPETIPSADPVAAYLGEVGQRLAAAQDSSMMAAAGMTRRDRDARRLLAAVKTALSALARHQRPEWTEELGSYCAGCLSDWPCPDIKAISEAFLGTEGDGDE